MLVECICREQIIYLLQTQEHIQSLQSWRTETLELYESQNRSAWNREIFYEDSNPSLKYLGDW